MELSNKNIPGKYPSMENSNFRSNKKTAVDPLKSEYEKKDATAKKILILSLGATELKYLLNCETAEEIYIKLCSLYRQKDEVESLRSQIRTQEVELKDNMVLIKIISSFFAAYSSFNTNWKSTPANERTSKTYVAEF
ncbi:hypothetical protein HHI36_006294 [Cryptolaemus montrouzieri]|uniref:Uncharacterized protein n=1 Tax=Cryptolaemus montrouzieri TaxID=559131 RepID=A0ABD2NWX3_9CUCU